MMMHYATRYMIDNNIKGNIINITSSRGERVYSNCGLYCGIKTGINRANEIKEDYWDQLGPKIPLERCAEPEDVVNAVEFLISD